MSYSLSFTAASLLPQAMRRIVEIQLQTDDWDLTRQHILTENVLQTSRKSSSVRQSAELLLRLQTLSHEEQLVLATASSADRVQICFVACCRAYPFLRHMTLELLRPKALSYQIEIRKSDYFNWYEQEAAVYPRLNSITVSTRDKLRSRCFALLAEANLIDSPRTRIITPPLVSEVIEDLLLKHRPSDLNLFLGPARRPVPCET